MNQFKKFVSVGFFVFLANNAIFSVCFWLTEDASFALLVAYFLGLMLSFFAQSSVTFHGTRPIEAAPILRFFFLNLFALLANFVLLNIFSPWLVGFEVVVFQILCSIVLSLLSFLFLKSWVFKD